MKQKTDLSIFSIIATLASIALFVFLIFFNHPLVYVQMILACALVLMLGCRNAPQMVKHIKTFLKQ